MCVEEVTNHVAAGPYGVGDAVGLSDAKWFVAMVNHNTEKASAEKLERMGFDCYVATQREVKIWRNGRKAKVDRIVIPSTIFIRCTEKERRNIVAYPFINRFMTNKAANTNGSLNRPLAIIPDDQIRLLRFMLGNSDSPVTIGDRIRTGDRVRVIRGSLRGIEGMVIDTPDGKSELIIAIDVFGSARLMIDRINLETIS